MVPLASSPKGVDVAKLYEYLGCGIEEMTRDIETLIMCGVPPHTPSDYAQAYIEDGRLHIAFPVSLRRPVHLSGEEHASIQCALMQVARIAGHAEAPAAKNLMSKFARPRRTRWLREKDVVECSVSVKIPEGGRVALQKAIDERRKIEIEYHSLRSGETTARTVRPYALIARSCHWYLIAHDERRGKVIPFRGDRIRHIETGEARFERPADFDAARYLSGRMFFDVTPAVHARVRFGPDYARFIAERFPPECLDRREGGGVDLLLDTDSLKWAARWVMKHGSYATVESPKELREEIVKMCDEILARYQR